MGKQQHKMKDSANMSKFFTIALDLGVMVAGVALSAYVIGKLMDPHAEEKRKGKERMSKLRKLLKRDVDLTSYEMMVIGELVTPEHLDATLDEVGGLRDEKNRLRQLIVEPLRHPSLFKDSSLLALPRGVLLYGPPGTGKTMLARALAKESGAHFINAKASLLLNKYYGESQKLVHALFTLASKLSPCVVFVDEVDALLGRRTDADQDHNTQLKTEFMQMWDGFSQTDHLDVVVLGATNRPWALDDAVLRRFSVQIEVGLPSARDRAKILHKILAREKLTAPHHVSDELVSDPMASEPPPALLALAKRTEGFSGSNLKDLCMEAARVWMSDKWNDLRSGDGTSVSGRPSDAIDAPRGLRRRASSRMGSYGDAGGAMSDNGISAAHFERVLNQGLVNKSKEAALKYQTASQGPPGNGRGGGEGQLQALMQLLLQLQNGA